MPLRDPRDFERPVPAKSGTTPKHVYHMETWKRVAWKFLAIWNYILWKGTSYFFASGPPATPTFNSQNK